MPNWSLTEPFQIADDAWSAELHRRFGKNAGDVRYTPQGRGEFETTLRALYEKREAARRAWEGGR